MRLITLGGLSLEAPGEEASSLARQRRKLAVLVVLALSKRPIARESLANMFWGEQDEARARHSLAEALSHLRRVLGREAIATRVTDVALAPDADLSIDAAAFAEAACAGDHQRAASLYGGAFLDSVHLQDAPDFTSWVDRERARLQTLFHKVAAQQCLALARHRRWEECAALSERWLQSDPLSADAAIFRLNALKADGTRESRTLAVTDFERFRERLRRDYDLEPDTSVISLANDIAGQLAATRTAEAHSAGPARPAAEPTIREGSPLLRPGAVVESSSTRSSEDVQQATTAPPPFRFAPPVTRRMVAAAALLLAVASLLIWRTRGTRTPDRAASSGPISIAVFPFVSAGADSAPYLAESFADEVGASLARVQGLRVIAAPRLAVGGGLTIVGEGRRLGAELVLDGTTAMTTSRVRVVARLLDARTGDRLWTHTYDRAADDLMGVERDLATQTVNAARRVHGSSVGALERRHAVDPQVYDLYLRGRYFSNRSGSAAITLAENYFGQAIARDSSFAPAWAGLAAVRLRRFSWGASYGESVPRARSLVEHALELDPGQASAHVTLAELLSVDWRWSEAVAELRRALELNPADVEAHHLLSHVYFAMHRLDDALVEAKRASAIEPLNPRIAMHLCVAYTVLRSFADALAACRRGIELDPSFPDSHSKLAWVLLRLGRFDEARSELALEVASDPQSANYVAQLALLDAYSGKSARARALVDSLERATPESRLPFTALAVVRTKLGEKDRALALLHSAVIAHGGDVEDLVLMPEFDDLAGDPRFQAILRETGQSTD